MTARIMIMAGGTGGHVFPALAVAEELRARGAEVFWLGTRGGMEAELVPAAGIDMEWISIAGLRGKGLLGWLLAPLRLAKAVSQSLEVILRRRPMAILGMGGFVAGPGGVVSWLLRKPLLIHEQNAVAGMTNRLLARLASRIMEAFPDTFKHSERVIATGNPVRAQIADLPQPAQRFAGRAGSLRLLVLGGSLGAQALNEMVPQALAMMPADQRPDVWHQAGKRNIDTALQQYTESQLAGRVEAFISDMAEAYAWADLVLCRAGALTVSELAAAGVGAMLVPFPYAVDDHQTANARYLCDNGAALLLPQSELSAARLKEIIAGFMRDCAENQRAELQQMADKARALAKPYAAQQVADLCMEASNE
ncbi:UDP-N-acetylglucosamine--N-acetylmuramyl-(pentapeptide) pyrophosphoryl-undecaprenol N-acetylglucosamine transferase [Candidatus Tenderia electrophaga]|jgi:UDP-N-acetylglucosamine--N-acetylmuramyl-(pentapeptide) pyrophosphoryl-undecaprenol N-acetylglucosamine transferase|uniref:UDP-N-acetylglucosamine--N-acetylmuramyl-(pentapeptide) pyrophosphoryl-undecaprenol N-acetylglucosamine transferase n=1 Tax=Candidatus Tenderia electrophaga TaxID=1748243 RepID=A0A0S2TB07_9GAMM|nr:UDP-N-acetylglucosamine--N-acetylmuramyl-(pentapeptide) pyrophosphoryl-undecaprenol N-acetylglucosamine transferase [Candidatus Tenderia electrophaga]